MGKLKTSIPTTEKQVIKLLFNNIGHKVASPNIYAFGWESDLLMITEAGYAVEYEVKITVSDFKSDFLKKGSVKSYNYYPRSTNYFTKTEDLVGKRGPNRFYYVVPTDLIKVEDVPDYAGLIYVNKRYHIVVKKAPLLHKTKDWDKIINKINVSNYYKVFNRL